MKPKIEMYFVWSIEHNAWWANTNGYTVQISHARQYTHEHAMEICHKALIGGLRERLGGRLPEVPVAVSDVEQMLARLQFKD